MDNTSTYIWYREDPLFPAFQKWLAQFPYEHPNDVDTSDNRALFAINCSHDDEEEAAFFVWKKMRQPSLEGAPYWVAESTPATEGTMAYHLGRTPLEAQAYRNSGWHVRPLVYGD